MDQNQFLEHVKNNRRYASKDRSRLIIDISPQLGVACYINQLENGIPTASDLQGALPNWEEAKKWCDGEPSIAPLKNTGKPVFPHEIN